VECTDGGKGAHAVPHYPTVIHSVNEACVLCQSRYAHLTICGQPLCHPTNHPHPTFLPPHPPTINLHTSWLMGWQVGLMRAADDAGLPACDSMAVVDPVTPAVLAQSQFPTGSAVSDPSTSGAARAPPGLATASQGELGMLSGMPYAGLNLTACCLLPAACCLLETNCWGCWGCRG